jgi:hypothetical protein
LQYAYARCKAKQAAPGVDGKRFKDIEAYFDKKPLEKGQGRYD